jgi:DnaJ-class molecular chaperone
MRTEKQDDATTEMACDACSGKGYPPVKEVALGRRIYPAPCKKCGGKGRIAAGWIQRRKP